MRTKRLTPAEYVIRELGGPAKTARLVGRHISTVMRWGRVNGSIPVSVHRRILQVAREKNINITADDLINGRVEV